MAFELKLKEKSSAGIRRIARERMYKALKLLTENGGNSPPDEAIHEARRRFKELRALLRLVKAQVGRKRYKRESRTIREASRPLSQLRDAKVMVDTLDALTAHSCRALPSGPSEQLRTSLEARHREFRKIFHSKGMAKIVKDVRKACKRSRRWPFAHRSWKGISAGLTVIYDRGSKAMAKAVRTPSDEAFHEARKRTKDLRYALELLSRIAPRIGALKAIHRFTDLLGEDHDLAVLHRIVESEFGKIFKSPERELLAALFRKRRHKLQGQARTFGAKIYQSETGPFMQRIRADWSTSRHQR
jgi:CHAD domain-containing protein